MTATPEIGQVVIVRVTRSRKGPDTQYSVDYYYTNGMKFEGKVVCNTPQMLWYLLENAQQERIAMNGISFDSAAPDITEIWGDDNSIRPTNLCTTAATISIRLGFVDLREPHRPVVFSSSDPQIVNEPGNTGGGG